MNCETGWLLIRKDPANSVKEAGRRLTRHTFLSGFRFDCLGESPYTVTEVVLGRLWKIKYEFVKGFIGSQARNKSFGWNPLDPNFSDKVLASARQFGPKAVEVAHQDLAKAVDLYGRESVSDQDLFANSFSRSVNSYVVKLRSGSLLLYAPVKIREEVGFGQWLDSLGEHGFDFYLEVEGV